MTTARYRRLTAVEKQAYCARSRGRYARLKRQGLCARCATEPKGRTIYCAKCELVLLGPSRRSACQRCQRRQVNVVATGDPICWRCRWGK